MDNNVLLAFFLTLLAGLSTGIGSLIAFLYRHTNRKFLSVALGFSAGVMVYVSTIEIFVKAKDSLVAFMGYRLGNWVTVIAFSEECFLSPLSINSFLQKKIPTK